MKAAKSPGPDHAKQTLSTAFSLSLRLSALGAVYFSQGISSGFFAQVVPIELRKGGVSLRLIGLLSLVQWVPLTKLLVSPWVDGAGTRRSWIVVTQVSAAFWAATLLFGADRHVGALILAQVLLTALFAVQDTAGDGLAVDILNPDERGEGNSMQVGAHRLGVVFGGGALVIWVGRFGWASASLLMGVVLILALLPLKWLGNSSRVPCTLRPSVVALARETWSSPMFLIAALFRAGDTFGNQMVRPFLVDRGFSMVRIGTLLGTVGMAAAVVLAMASGVLWRIVGARLALLSCGLALAASMLACALVSLRSAPAGLLWMAVVLHEAARSAATVSMLAAIMCGCKGPDSATRYALFSSAEYASGALAGAVSGFSAQALGYTAHFAVSALLTVLATVAVRRAVRRPWNGVTLDA